MDLRLLFRPPVSGVLPPSRMKWPRPRGPRTVCRPCQRGIPMTPFCRNLSQRTLALGLGAFLGLAALAGAQPWARPAHQPGSGVHVFPSRNVRQPILKSGVNLTYHGGPVITSAHVVFIFWGPSFNN